MTATAYRVRAAGHAYFSRSRSRDVLGIVGEREGQDVRPMLNRGDAQDGPHLLEAPSPAGTWVDLRCTGRQDSYRGRPAAGTLGRRLNRFVPRVRRWIDVALSRWLGCADGSQSKELDWPVCGGRGDLRALQRRGYKQSRWWHREWHLVGHLPARLRGADRALSRRRGPVDAFAPRWRLNSGLDLPRQHGVEQRSIASRLLSKASAGTPKCSSYQRCTRASLQTSTTTSRSANSSAALSITTSWASEDRSRASKHIERTSELSCPRRRWYIGAASSKRTIPSAA